MSAIRCKIILCGQETASLSEAPTALIDEVEKDSSLANAIILAQDDYAAKMKKLLSELTNGKR